MKTPERHLASTPSVFIVKFEHISHLAIMFLLFTLKIELLAGISQPKIPKIM